MLKKLLSVLLLAILVFTIVFNRPATAEKQDGKQIFTANCTACHMGGNNVIIASKNLKLATLKQYNMNSLEAIKNQVKNGKNAMPAFGGRLSDEQVEAVATYVMQQAEKGW